MKPEPRAILAIDASPFGKSLALLPAMRAIREAYPKTYIVVAASKGTSEILQAFQLADETIELGVIKSIDTSPVKAAKRLIKLAAYRRRHEIDLVLNFSPSVESQILSRFSGRARTITPSKLTNIVDFFLGSRSRARESSSNYSNVIRQLGLDISDTRFAIELPAEENAQFEKLLAKNGSRGGEPLVLLYSAGNVGPDGWPVESFGEVATRLSHNFGARIIASDEPADKAFTAAIGALLPKGSIKMAEPRALQLAAATARASLLITDEKGLAELASGLSTPAIEISDSTSARALAKTHRVVTGASRARITTDEVYEIACELLQDSRSFILFQR